MKTLRSFAALAGLLCVAGMGAAADDTERAFTAKDLVMLDRVSDPQVAPDGQSVVFSVRETNWAANKGVNSLWRLALGAKESRPERITMAGSNASSPRWAPDGKSLYFLSDRSGSDQVWRLGDGRGRGPPGHAPAAGRAELHALARRHAPGLRLEVFPDCADLACTKKRLDERSRAKAHRADFHDAVHPPLGHLGRRPPHAPVRLPARMPTAVVAPDAAPPDAGDQRRRALEALRRRRGVRLLARRPHARLRRAHRRPRGALVDQLRPLRGASRRQRARRAT